MKKRRLRLPVTIIVILVIVFSFMFVKQTVLDNRINNDFTPIYSDANRMTPVSASGIGIITQEISCGYANIELLADWLNKPVTEESLFEQNGGKVSTATGNGFLKEMNKQFPEYDTVRHKNLTNLEFLQKVYDSLSIGRPVPFEFAAYKKDGDAGAWTLHYAIATAMDIGKDSITISNPYGYEEVYSLNDFLDATSYESYEDMEFYIKMGFAAGVFSKNTVYILQ